MFLHQHVKYNSKIALISILNYSCEIIFKSLSIFNRLILTLFSLSQLVSIFHNMKASWTLDGRENRFAMVAMLLEFMVTISSLHSFAIGL
jgi:hypothetical protein